MIEWPALIKCGDHDELLFLSTESEWLELQQSSVLQRGDILVDSHGRRFDVDSEGAKSGSAQLTLEQVLHMVRQHASVCGHCCVSKLGAVGISEAVAMVQDIN